MGFSIVLSGGGARGAYQAGSLRALYEICRDAGNLSPFENLVGLSAGAINGSFIAAHLNDLDQGTDRLCDLWRNLRTQDVLKTDAFSVSGTAFKLVRSLSLGGISRWLRASKVGLLNTRPLNQLIQNNIDFNQIQKNVDDGLLRAFCITATDYSTSLGVSFFTGSEEIQQWKRYLRVGLRSPITADHVMASASIPIFFPPWPIGDRFFGDGCLRNTAPLSPAIHMGANKLIVLGVRKWKEVILSEETNLPPSLGRIISVLINAILMDAIEVDIERIRIINEALHLAPESPGFKKLEVFYMNPSVVLSEIAASHVDNLPQILRFLIGGLGTPEESGEILSYLTFDGSYCSKLVELGYSDLMEKKENFLQFLNS